MKWIIFIFLLCLVGCTMTNHQKLYPLPKSGILVIENKIYYNSELFAELRYFTDKNYKGFYYKGVAIYYHRYDKEVWIFPEKGWSIHFDGKDYFTVQEIDTIWKQYQTERDELIAGKRDRLIIYKDIILFLEGKNVPKIQPTVGDVKISEDGQHVYYKTSGIFASHKYLVEYGISGNIGTTP